MATEALNKIQEAMHDLRVGGGMNANDHSLFAGVAQALAPANSQEFLTGLSDLIHRLEHFKYPDHDFSTAEKETKIDGKTHRVLWVQSKRDESEDQAKLTAVQKQNIAQVDSQKLNKAIREYQIASVSFLIRKLSIIAGAVTTLAEPDFMDSALVSKADIFQKLIADANDAITQALQQANNTWLVQPAAVRPVEYDTAGKVISKLTKDFIKGDENSALSQFVDNLAKQFKIPDTSKPLLPIELPRLLNPGLRILDRLTDQIRKGERYFVSELNAKKVLVSQKDDNANSETILEIDIPYSNRMTDQQKDELLRMHGQEKDWPVWIRLLEPWERAWLQNKIPLSFQDDWSDFEKLFQSSAMQNLPGVKNARLHYLFYSNNTITNPINYDQPLSASSKTATLLPYETGADAVRLAEMNVHQVVQELSGMAIERTQRIWGNRLQDLHIDPNKPLIFFNSLMSDVIAGGDRSYIEKQNAAFKAATENQDNIIFGNNSINYTRKGITGELKLKHQREILAYAQKFDVLAADYGNQVLTPEQQFHFQIIKEAREKVQKFTNLLDVGGRNKAAFLSAYLSLMVEAMGGVPSSNCKSGKDRTGLDEIYKDAMLVYFKKYGKLPDYYDQGQDRQNYIDIFRTLFNMRKAMESAAMNTPGSYGLKDKFLPSRSVLCQDIEKDLNKDPVSRHFLYSNKRAGWNKPSQFTSLDSSHVSKTKELGRKELQKHLDTLMLSFSEKQAFNDLVDSVNEFSDLFQNKKMTSSRLVLIEQKKEELQDLSSLTRDEVRNKIQAEANFLKETQEFVHNTLLLESMMPYLSYLSHSEVAKERVRHILSLQPANWLTQLNEKNCAFKKNELDQLRDGINDPDKPHPYFAAQEMQATAPMSEQEFKTHYGYLRDLIETSALGTPMHAASAIAPASPQFTVYRVNNDASQGEFVTKHSSHQHYASFVKSMPETVNRRNIVRTAFQDIREYKVRIEIEKVTRAYQKAVLENQNIDTYRNELSQLLGEKTTARADSFFKAIQDTFYSEYTYKDPVTQVSSQYRLPCPDLLDFADHLVKNYIAKCGVDREMIIQHDTDPTLAQSFVLIARAKNLVVKLDAATLVYAPKQEEIAAVANYLEVKMQIKVQQALAESQAEIDFLNKHHSQLPFSQTSIQAIEAQRVNEAKFISDYQVHAPKAGTPMSMIPPSPGSPPIPVP